MSAIDEMDGEDLLQALMAPAPSEVFEFVKVRNDGTERRYPVRVRLLRVDEEHQALKAAQAYAKANGEVSKDYGDIYKEAQAVEVLVRALCFVQEREKADGKGSYYPQLFVDSAHLRRSFSNPEMAQCLNMYEIVTSKYGAITHFTDEEFEVMIAKLADPLRGPLELSQIQSAHWPLLLLRSAQELHAVYESRPTQSDSPSSSESDQPTSNTDTGFSTLPAAAHSESNTELPTDHMLSKEEAGSVAKSIRDKDK